MSGYRPAGLRRLVALLAPHKGRWVLATAMLFLGGLVNLALPQGVRLAIDLAVANQDTGLLAVITLATIGAFLVLALLTFGRHYLMSWLGQRVVAELRDRTFRHLMRQPPGYFHERQSGEMISRLTSDIGMLHSAVGSEFSVALRSLMTVVGGIIILFVMAFWLSLAMIVTVPPVALAAVWLGRRIRRRSREVQDQLAVANRGLKEAVVGIETVQAFGAEEHESGRYFDRVMGAFRSALRVALMRGAFMGGAMFAGYTAIAVILWLGAAAVIDDSLSSGELASFILYTVFITGALVTLAQLWANLQSALGAAERVFEILDDAPAIRDSPDAVALPNPDGRVRFDGVSFAYPSRPDVPVLRDVSFTVEPGEMVALVGSSGAGKSTITKLLMRFYDVAEGSISVDGHDVRTIRLDDLRAGIAPVQQEPMLFSGSIRDNIAYGFRDATDAAIRQAAANAMIADFVESLPDAYDTTVGERGVRLSGGQRQRIAIARALLANPRILVLDEATSHLDTANEALVHEALERLMRGRTTLVIAHRLSTVQNADRILVIDGGRLVESGTHQELLAGETVYRRLTAQQVLP